MAALGRRHDQRRAVRDGKRGIEAGADSDHQPAGIGLLGLDPDHGREAAVWNRVKCVSLGLQVVEHGHGSRAGNVRESLAFDRPVQIGQRAASVMDRSSDRDGNGVAHEADIILEPQQQGFKALEFGVPKSPDGTFQEGAPLGKGHARIGSADIGDE